MSTKLIITESQYNKILNFINESNFHEKLVEMMVSDLDMNYEPMLGVMREEGEYFEEPMVRIKVDKSEISPKELFEYFKKKYKLGDDFTKQVIQDWMFGNIKNNMLTKNVPIN
jgi:hypothetical protein